MTRQEAINAMQAHLGCTVLVINLNIDNDSNWIADIVPNDNDGEIIGLINLPDHGRSAPYVSWG